MAAHGVPRATGDIDVWVAADGKNAACVFRALADFGAPLLAVPVLGREDLLTNKRAAGRPKDIADIAALSATAK